MSASAPAAPPPAPPPVLPTAAQAVGLTSAEVLELRAKYGPNEVVQEGTPAWLRLCVLARPRGARACAVARARRHTGSRAALPARRLKTLYGPIPAMLVLTIIIAGLLHKWETLGMISALLLVNCL